MSHELDQRALHILRCVVDCYLETGEPVSSRTISKKVDLSPATIRNTMADLEELDFLYSPHTSSGRTPTSEGVNMFLDDISDINADHDNIMREIERLCEQENTTSGVLEDTTEKISNITNSVALAVYPKDDIFVEHVEIKSISNGRLLLLIVFSDGNVKSIVFRPTNNVTSRTLLRATEYLSSILSGKSLNSIKNIVNEYISISRSQYDYDTAVLIKDALRSELIEDTDNYFIIKGQVNLFNSVENIQQLNNAKKMCNVDDIKNTFLVAVDELKNSDTSGIFVGEDSLDMGCSLVLSPCFSYNGNIMGAVGIICHSKTNYKKMIPIIRFTAKMLSKL